MASATLLVIQGIEQGTRYELPDGPVGIGRGAGNEVRILDTEVSRRHATIEPQAGRFLLTDLDSSNGTLVNGEPVRTRMLRDGDQLQFGRSVLLFSSAANKEEETLHVADRIDFLNRHDPGDRSSIVGEVGREAGDRLLPPERALKAEGSEQVLANLQALYRISEVAVSPSISLEQLLQRILDVTIEVVGADRGCVLLADPQTGEIRPRVFSHRPQFAESAKMPVSRSIVDYVLKNGHGVRTSDAQSDDRFEAGQSILQAGIREAMCVPMRGRYELMGVVYVDTTTPPERVILSGRHEATFTEERLRLLVAIGRQGALAVEDNRFQQAYVQAERLAAVGQTIATLSHHIKNILQGIRGGSYLIDMGLTQHDEGLIAKGWGIVEKNQNKIYQLVMDMLTFSKERKPVVQRANLNETVADVCELMQPRAEECRVSIHWQADENLPETAFDPEAVHRAVLNVVTNAIDAAEGIESGTVRISTRYDRAQEAVSVCIEDNGPGIPPDQLETIFNLFESTKGARGTGLGLAVSRKIIREHGGDIHVTSTPGDGCCFTLSWPLSDEPRSRTNPDMQTMA